MRHHASTKTFLGFIGTWVLFSIFVWGVVIILQGGIISKESDTSVSSAMMNGITIINIGLAGMIFAYSTYFVKKTDEQLGNIDRQLGEIVRRLDSGLIITQNITAVLSAEKSKNQDVSLSLRGMMAGVMAGILGGIFVSSLFDLISYQESPAGKSFPIISTIVFIVSIAALIYVIWFVVSIIEKIEKTSNSDIILRQ